MQFSFLKRGDWRVLQGLIVGLAAVVLVLAWGITLQRLDSDKALTLQKARAQQNNLAVIVSENVGQLLEGARLIAIASREWWEDSPEEAAGRLSAMPATNPAFPRIALYDTNAVRVYSSSPVADAPPTEKAVRDALQSASTTDFRGLILPAASSAGEAAWHTPLLFPVGESGEAPMGMLMVMLDLGYLLKVYRNIEFGASGVIHLLTREGDEVLEWRPEGLMLNSRKHHFGAFPNQTAATGWLTTDLFHDGRLHLSSFSRVERLSFLLVVSRSLEDILAVHQKARTHSLMLLGLMTVIVAGGAHFIFSGIGRYGKLFGALVASDKRNRALIDRLKDEKGRAFMLAAHDHLTGLPNRRTFTELATSQLNDSKRDRGHYALMYLDLDRFKSVNDTLGHHVGDFLLQTVATRLRESLRGSDVVARLGGDEFAILLTNLTSVDELALIAKKIIRRVSQPFHAPEGQEIRVGPSIGIAVFPRDGEDFDTLCRNADAAMYESKRMGRSTYTYYNATLNASSKRMFSMGQGLSKAIAQDELVLHFQPKVRLSDFTIVGLEALVRWQHPEFGLVYPDDFIPLAEETGLIEALGDWVARACCRQQAMWRAQGLDCVPVAINMSALQLKNEDLPARIESLLVEHDLTPDMLAIEITESVLLDSLEAASQVLQRLEALGVQISLDDFGSGFSSLGYVRSLPIHIIKIDKQFIRDIRNKPHDAVLTASIISLAHNLGKQVVAEGVETVDQLIYLKTAGCDMAQGYHFSRPVPAASARELLKQGQLVPQQASV